MAKFIVSNRTNGECQFNLVASNGQTILSSEGYTTKAACLNGVESVRNNAVVQERYEIRTAANGKSYFVLKAANHQVIGTSQMYADQASCMNGIQSVMTNAPDATVEDNTM